MTEIEKVTVFVARTVNGRRELLLFQHPYACIQIPALAVFMTSQAQQESDPQPS